MDTNRHLIDPAVPVATASETWRAARAASLFPSPRGLNVLNPARDLVRRLSTAASPAGGRYMSATGTAAGAAPSAAVDTDMDADMDTAHLPRAIPAITGTTAVLPPSAPTAGTTAASGTTAAAPTVAFAQAYNAGLDFDCVEIDARFVSPTSARAVTVLPRLIDGDTPRTVDGVPVAGIGIGIGTGTGTGALRRKPQSPSGSSSPQQQQQSHPHPHPHPHPPRSSIRTSAREVPVAVASLEDGDEGEAKTSLDP